MADALVGLVCFARDAEVLWATPSDNRRPRRRVALAGRDQPAVAIGHQCGFHRRLRKLGASILALAPEQWDRDRS